MTVQEIIKKRRTVRKFTQERISDDVLLGLIDGARYAASGANLQPLKYRILNDEKTVEAVFPYTKWAGYTPGETPKAGERPTAFIAVFGDREIRKDFECDAGASITNMLLLAEDKGIGACWLGSVDRKKVMEILDVDTERFELVYLVAMGYPAQKSEVVECVDKNIKYYLTDDGVLKIPKRSLDEILI